jgi:hypothetical protein
MKPEDGQQGAAAEAEEKEKRGTADYADSTDFEAGKALHGEGGHSGPSAHDAREPPAGRKGAAPSFGAPRAVVLGTELATGMAVFSLLGYWLDRRSGGGIGWTLGGMFMGLVYGGYAVWKTVRGMVEEAKDTPAGAGKKKDRGSHETRGEGPSS